MNDGPSETTHGNGPGLLPRLGLMTATLVVVSTVIGSGVFKKAAPMAVDVQSAGLLYARHRDDMAAPT